jgi:hypothetical protein
MGILLSTVCNLVTYHAGNSLCLSMVALVCYSCLLLIRCHRTWLGAMLHSLASRRLGAVRTSPWKWFSNIGLCSGAAECDWLSVVLLTTNLQLLVWSTLAPTHTGGTFSVRAKRSQRASE